MAGEWVDGALPTTPPASAAASPQPAAASGQWVDGALPSSQPTGVQVGVQDPVTGQWSEMGTGQPYNFGSSTAEMMNNAEHPWNVDELKAAMKANGEKAARGALTGIGAGIGGVAGFASPLPGGAVAGTLLGGGIGKAAGNAIFGQEQPEAPAINPAAGQGFTANAKEMLSNIPSSAVKTANAGLGMMSDLSTAAVTPGGGERVLQGVGQSIKDLGGTDAWVTNPVGNAATLGMIAEPLRAGASRGMGKVGFTANPELTALSQEHNVPLTVGEESGNASAQGLETQLERVPMVGTRGFRQVQSSALGDAANRLIDKFTPDNPVDVPDQIQASMLKTLKQGKSDVGNIQNQISEAVQSGKVEPINPHNARVEAAKLLTEYPDIFDRLPSTPIRNMLNNIIKGTEPESTPKVGSYHATRIASQKAARSGDFTSYGDTPTAKPVGQLTQLPWGQTMRFREMLNNYIDRAYKSAGAVGSKETYQLTAIKRALDNDISEWGENSQNSKVVDLFKQRNQTYIDKVVPFKDAIVKTATGNKFDTDLLYNQFIKSDRPQLAQKLMDALDPEGQQLVKYSVLKKAVEAGQDTKPGVPFSPAKFAQSIEKLGATKSVIFPGAEGSMVTGLAKLARAAERAGQYAESPPTGLRASDTGISVGIGGGMVMHPLATSGVLAMLKTVSSLLTTPWGKSVLMKSSKLPSGSPAFGPLLSTITQNMSTQNHQRKQP